MHVYRHGPNSACHVAQVDVMKEAYTQVLESEEDDDSVGDQIKPRDVGHNIYILAHQVWEGGNTNTQLCFFFLAQSKNECTVVQRSVLLYICVFVCLPALEFISVARSRLTLTAFPLLLLQRLLLLLLSAY